MNEESKLIELFKKYPGIAARIRRSFAYHYDQIQREIESEVATINKKTMLQPLSIILPNTWRNPWVGLTQMTKPHLTINLLNINQEGSLPSIKLITS